MHARTRARACPRTRARACVRALALSLSRARAPARCTRLDDHSGPESGVYICSRRVCCNGQAAAGYVPFVSGHEWSAAASDASERSAHAPRVEERREVDILPLGVFSAVMLLFLGWTCRVKKSQKSGS